MNQGVLQKEWIIVVEVKVTVQFKTSLNVCQSYIFCTADLTASKLGM